MFLSLALGRSFFLFSRSLSVSLFSISVSLYLPLSLSLTLHVNKQPKPQTSCMSLGLNSQEAFELCPTHLHRLRSQSNVDSTDAGQGAGV